MAYSTETPGLISSVGALGTHPRSDGRVVTTLAQPLQNTQDLRPAVRATAEAMRMHSATRAQLKVPGHPELARAPVLVPFVEGVLDASNGTQKGVIFMAHNRGERNQIPETWDEVREIWQQPLAITPAERVTQLISQGYHFTTQFTTADIPRMTQIWRPFGWKDEGVAQWLADYAQGTGGWACGVRGPTGQIEALAKAEELELAGISLVESTEWGTHPQNRAHGLGTTAAIGLNAQILMNPPETHGWTVFAEANMARDLPGHRVARNAGFQMCGDPTSEKPNGVLRQHVSVDGQLRDFLLVQLTPHSIKTHYPDSVLRLINSYTLS